jgi:ribosomal peptide maturation radical SAM protein 1
MKEQILSALKGGDILLIVPPFTIIESPLLGVHILQALAVEQGYKTEILYLNVLLASTIGPERFSYIAFPPLELHWEMLAERLFARSAYGLSPLGKSPGSYSDEVMSISGNKEHHIKMFYKSNPFDRDTFLEIEEVCYSFVNEAAAVIASLNYKITGFTQMEGQTNCSIALLNGIKSIRPGIVTLTGGANCNGELAQGIASLSDSIDYIFSGESEISFRDFLEGYSMGKFPSGRIIPGKPVMDLDSLPLPDYTCFFHQTKCFLGKDALEQTAVSYETSRGCWWGEKQRCNFCSENHVFRQKTAGKVLDDLKQIRRHYQTRKIFMCDAVMPLSYHKEIFPRLLEEKEFLNIYYLSKANLNLHDLINLKKVKVDQFTIGIESFSAGLLELMNKGLTVRQNLQFLRNARSVGLYLDWLLLWGLPGDKAKHYEETLDLLPLIRHLQPPVTFLHMLLARFSPYVEKARDFHIINLRPWAVYNMIYPEWADVNKLAGWFAGDYPCEAHEHPQLIEKIVEEVDLWKTVWKTTYLVMVPFNDCYLILDNRDGRGKKQHVLDYRKAKEVMTLCPYNESEYRQWAVEEKLGARVDSWYVPLVTASPELLLQFEE